LPITSLQCCNIFLVLRYNLIEHVSVEDGASAREKCCNFILSPTVDLIKNMKKKTTFQQGISPNTAKESANRVCNFHIICLFLLLSRDHTCSRYHNHNIFSPELQHDMCLYILNCNEKKNIIRNNLLSYNSHWITTKWRRVNINFQRRCFFDKANINIEKNDIIYTHC
jgi:hypothetical protein